MGGRVLTYVVRRGTLRWTAQGVRSADRRRHGREARGAAHIPRAARMIHDPSIIFFYSSRCSHFISYIFSIESPLLLLLPPSMGTSVVIRSSYLTQRSTDSRMGPLGSRSSARERLYPGHPIARRPHHSSRTSAQVVASLDSELTRNTQPGTR